MEPRDQGGLSESEFLERYHPGGYPRPLVATDMVIFTVAEPESASHRKLPEKELRVLLIHRRGPPFLGKWALPGGFLQPDETVGAAARRELFEEAGLDNIYLEQLYTFSEPDRDPRSWVLSCSHMGLVNSGSLTLRAGDGADVAAWFRLSLRRKENAVTSSASFRERWLLELTDGQERLSAEFGRTLSGPEAASPDSCSLIENTGLAFDHARIISYAVERLRSKIQYTDIAFHLLPPLFTLTELQQVYEVVLDRPLLKAAFRRKTAQLVCETDRYTHNTGHRPARLYCQKKTAGL